MSIRQHLEQHIIELSRSNSFCEARMEWELQSFELHDEWDNCPCGQDIKDLCHIKNKYNGKETYVGNVCINQFMGITTGQLFEGIRRIKENPTTKYTLDSHAEKCGYLHFLMNIKNKRILSEGQESWRNKINRRILQKTIVSKKNSV